MGNWTLKSQNNTIDSQEFFQIYYYSERIKLNFTEVVLYTARTLFKNETQHVFDDYFFDMLGFSNVQNSSFYFFEVPKRKIVNITRIALDNMTYSNSDNITQSFDLVRLQNYYKKIFRVEKVIVLNFTIGPKTTPPEYFLTTTPFNGYALHENFTLNIDGFLFDLYSYISEGKFLGILSGFIFIFSLYGWYSIFSVQSRTPLTQLSQTTYFMHVSFDFAYSIYLLTVSLQLAYFKMLFFLLSSSYTILLFTYQMFFISNLWRASTNFPDLQEFEFRRLFFIKFSQLTAIILASLLSILLVFLYPFFPLLFLYSPYITQIYQSAVSNTRKSHDELFIMLSSISRLMILWYLFAYEHNLMGSYSPPNAIFFTFYYSLQVLIVLLQNRYGGAFFLPRRFRARGYDYYHEPVPPNTECSICLSPIAENDETMVTPCHHCYHKACLTRWMNEQMICPICRMELPNCIDDEEAELHPQINRRVLFSMDDIHDNTEAQNNGQDENETNVYN